MVKITNGTVTTEVTQGAYNTFYKEQGFVIITKTKISNGRRKWLKSILLQTTG